MQTPKCWIVTGATGYIGSALTSRLLEEGYFVVGVSRHGNGFLTPKILNNHRFKLVLCDLCQGISKNVPRRQVEGIFHLAYQHNNQSSDNLLPNIAIACQVIALAKRLKTKAVVFSSSGSAVTSNSHYGDIKRRCEQLLINKLRLLPLKTIIFRLPAIFGGKDFKSPIYQYLQAALKNQDIQLDGRYKSLRSYLHLTNAVDMLLTITREYPHFKQIEILTASCKDALTLQEMAQLVIQEIGSRSKIILPKIQTPENLDVLKNAHRLEKILKLPLPSLKDSILSYIRES